MSWKLCYSDHLHCKLLTIFVDKSNSMVQSILVDFFFIMSIKTMKIPMSINNLILFWRMSSLSDTRDSPSITSCVTIFWGQRISLVALLCHHSLISQKALKESIVLLVQLSVSMEQVYCLWECCECCEWKWLIGVSFLEIEPCIRVFDSQSSRY